MTWPMSALPAPIAAPMIPAMAPSMKSIVGRNDVDAQAGEFSVPRSRANALKERATAPGGPRKAEARTRSRVHSHVLSDSGFSVLGMDHNEEDLHSVTISACGPKAEIEFDGARIEASAVRAYSISHFAGERPEIVLHVADREETQWSGLARVAVADLPDPGPAAAVFLDAIDPEALERAALARSDLGTEQFSLTKAMLAQLGEWARGL